MMVLRGGVVGLMLLGILVSGSVVRSAEVSTLLSSIRGVVSDGSGNREAARSWRELVSQDAAQLPTILAALDGAEPLAANWLCLAVDTIAERTVASGDSLPVKQLETFLLDTRHAPRGRRLAFEWLARVDATAADRLIPKMLLDPGVEFRRDAVARLLLEGADLIAKGKKPAAIEVYRRALEGARDNDQVSTIVDKLKSLGEQVDLPRHFGFLMDWRVIGAFDNSGRKGFATEFPPERELKREAKYAGKEGEVHWQDYTTKDSYGMVDLNQPLGKLKQTVAYAWTDFHSEAEQQVELRLGCKNAWKVWLNGELLFGRDEYHRGMRLDQYRMKATLQPGANQILVKACQNEQTESWTVEWQFQLRVCDATGTAVLSADTLSKP
ncbi:MAG: hypothetical protein VX346_04105 [Planctomycetota bacterium]|nr:hypothetical protein [Planctomycetota bacterium]